MGNHESLGDGEIKIIDMANYQRKKLIAGVLNRPSLEEEMKKYPSGEQTSPPAYDEKVMERFYHASDDLERRYSKEVPPMKVVYNKAQEQARLDAFFALSDHLE